MPTYELSLILRQMARPEVASALKRTATSILQRGGFLRKLENCGSRKLPHKMSSHGNPHYMGEYFLMHFDIPPPAMEDINEEWSRDVDIIRRSIVRLQEKPAIDCKLDEELLPPAYRRDVQEMIHQARDSKRFKAEQKRTGWSSNTGLDYYPFQK